MTVKTCDKCGLEINTNPMMNAIIFFTVLMQKGKSHETN